jgi:hypothetical protein
VLNSGEKYYCTALLALKRKDYVSASENFKKASPYYENNKEFNLFYETTRLLVEVKTELGKVNVEDNIEIEEIFSNG